MKLKRSPWEHCAKFLVKTDPELLNECIGSFLSDPSETDRFLWALCFLATHEGFDDSSFDEKQIKLFMDYLIFAKADTQKKVISLLMGSLKDKLDGYLSSTDTRQLTNYLDIFDTSPYMAPNGHTALHHIRDTKNAVMSTTAKNIMIRPVLSKGCIFILNMEDLRLMNRAVITTGSSSQAICTPRIAAKTGK